MGWGRGHWPQDEQFDLGSLGSGVNVITNESRQRSIQQRRLVRCSDGWAGDPSGTPLVLGLGFTLSRFWTLAHAATWLSRSCMWWFHSHAMALSLAFDSSDHHGDTPRPPAPCDSLVVLVLPHSYGEPRAHPKPRSQRWQLRNRPRLRLIKVQAAWPGSAEPRQFGNI
jgi:hypothetical protein